MSSQGHRNLDAGGHTGFAKDDQFQGPGWQSFVEIKAASWLHHYADWLQNNPLDSILVLHYENIQRNLKWVKQQYSLNHDDLQCHFYNATEGQGL